MQLPLTELESRVTTLQQALQKNDFIAAVILQRLDLYYFTGSTYPYCLIVPSCGNPVALARQEVPGQLLWPVVRVGKGEGLASYLAEVAGPKGKVGLELDVLPVILYQRMVEGLGASYKFADIGQLIRRQRAVKSAWELEAFRDTARRDLAVWAVVPDLLAHAATDLEVAAGIESAARRQGHQGLLKFRAFNEEIYLVTVLAGPAGAWAGPWDTPLSGPGVSPTFPQGASGQQLEPGQPIIIDYGGIYHGYIADQTRLFARKHLPPDLVKIYDLARRIQDAVVAAARPGVSCGDLYHLAARLAEEAGEGAHFMGPKRVPYIGHGVGLELDELPVLARRSPATLITGMVFALEPKFALPGVGAIGLENCFAVTEAGVERLTLASDDLIIV